MKKILVISVVSMVAAGAYAQGTINFNPRVAGQIVARVFSPETLNPTVQVTGNTSADTPAGTQVYTGVPIGGSGTGITGFTNGNRYTAQIFALAGTGDAASSLLAVSQYTATFRTTAPLAGFFNPPSISSDPGVPGAPGPATLQLRVWDNQGGTINDWATAFTTIGESLGASPTFNLTLGNPNASPPTTQPNLIGLVDFSLTTNVPEPSTIALGVMGAAAFLLRRRNK